MRRDSKFKPGDFVTVYINRYDPACYGIIKASSIDNYSEIMRYKIQKLSFTPSGLVSRKRNIINVAEDNIEYLPLEDNIYILKMSYHGY